MPAVPSGGDDDLACLCRGLHVGGEYDDDDDDDNDGDDDEGEEEEEDDAPP
jgi:hypothetical protein